MKQNKVIYHLKKLIGFLSLFVFSIVFSSIVCGQDNFSYQDYFPKQQVDSVEWYFGRITKEAADRIDISKNSSYNLESYFRNDEFPFDDPTPLLTNYFEKRDVLTDISDIQQLTKVFPTTDCENYSTPRCPPVYRDILVFYKNGIAVSVLKVCFSCKAVRFVEQNKIQDKHAKCLSNPLSIKGIAREWVRRGWIDLRKSR